MIDKVSKGVILGLITPKLISAKKNHQKQILVTRCWPIDLSGYSTFTQQSAPTVGFYHDVVDQLRYIERQERSQMNPLVLTFTLIRLYSLNFWAVALYRMMTYDTPI